MIFILGASSIKASFESIQNEAEEFTQEHDCALEVWMSEFSVMTVFILANNNFILHFHNNSVQGSKQKHKTHDRVEGNIGN